MIDLAFRFPLLVEREGRLARVLRACCVTPDRALLLMIAEKEQLRRLASKKEPFPDTEPTRALRFKAYEDLAKSGRVEVVDAARSVEAVSADIAARLGLAPAPDGLSSARC